MNDFARSVGVALSLIGKADPELFGIVALSLRVSLTASTIALVVGAPIGGWLAIIRFRGREAIIVLINALLGLPPVVVGLALYLLLSRSGPLGSAGLLFTPTAMVIAQTVLATPIVVALVHRPSTLLWAEYGDLARTDGLSTVRSIALLLALGRAFAPNGLSCRIRSGHRRSRRHYHRGRQYSQFHADDDHGDRTGNKQRRSSIGARARTDLAGAERCGLDCGVPASGTRRGKIAARRPPCSLRWFLAPSVR